MWSNAEGINASGQVVGSSVSDNEYGLTAEQAFVWSAGSGMAALSYPGDTFSNALGINASGQVAGFAFNFDGTTTTALQAVVWNPGSGVTGLGTLPGDTWSTAYAINASGQVLGFSGDDNQSRPFLWSAGSGMTDLSPVLGRVSRLSGLNDNGQIVGSHDSGNLAQVFVYTPGSGVVDLGTLPGDSESYAWGINASGQVVGGSVNRNGGYYPHAFVWSAGSGMTPIGSLPGDATSQAFGINASGQVVGYSGSGGNSSPFLWSASDGLIDLNTMIVNNMAGWTVYYGRAINDAGQIVGSGSLDGGVTSHAILLNPTTAPVPIPSAVWLFGSALAGLIGISRRRKVTAA